MKILYGSQIFHFKPEGEILRTFEPRFILSHFIAKVKRQIRSYVKLCNNCTQWRMNEI